MGIASQLHNETPGTRLEGNTMVRISTLLPVRLRVCLEGLKMLGWQTLEVLYGQMLQMSIQAILGRHNSNLQIYRGPLYRNGDQQHHRHELGSNPERAVILYSRNLFLVQGSDFYLQQTGLLIHSSEIFSSATQKQFMEGRVKELTEDLRRANEEAKNYSLIEETSEMFEVQIENAATRTEQLQRNTRAVENEFDEPQKKYDAAVYRYSVLEIEMEKVEEERFQCKKENTKLKSEIDELYGIMEEEHKTPNQLSIDLAAARKKSEETFDQLENTVDKLITLTKAHRTLQDEYDNLLASNVAVNLSHTQLELELDNAKGRIQAPEEPGRVAVLELDLRKARIALKAAERKVTETNAINNGTNAKVTTLSQELKLLREGKANGTVKQLQDEIFKLRKVEASCGRQGQDLER
ncbi:MAG: Myosin-8 [Icmadophila ericetorum]|nr:Myosin-8 [Icmadophila ericetorum]